MLYQKIIEHREHYLEKIANSPNLEFTTRLTKIIANNSDTNKFITIFDYRKGIFSFHHKVEQLTGYTDDEFSIPGINNSLNNDIHIIHPDDIDHKLRYDYLVMTNLSEMKRIITPLTDSYEIYMRIITKDGSTKRVNRQSYIFEINEQGFPIAQLDIWKIIPNDQEYVKVVLNYANWDSVYEHFYDKNRKFLGVDITKRQVEILQLRARRLENKTIADQLCISLRTVENHIHNLKQTIQNFCVQQGKSPNINNMNDLLHIIRKYGLVFFDYS